MHVYMSKETKVREHITVYLLLIQIANFGKQRIRKIRETIPSVTGFLEELRRNSSNTQLGMYIAN